MNDHDEEEDFEPNCYRCHDTGQIPAMDGFHEYLGYSYVPCSCAAGVQRIGLLGPSLPPWEC